MARPATAAVRLLTGEREPVRLATTGPIDVDAGGLLTIDGVVTEVGDRVLVKNQTDGSENGIRTVSAGQWYRAADARTNRTMQKGTTVTVQEGTAYSGKTFVFDTLDPVIGDDSLVITVIPDPLLASQMIDEDDMVSNSATKVPSQQSTKAYVDNKTVNQVAGPASAVADRVAVYSGTTGKLIKDGGGPTTASGQLINAMDGMTTALVSIFGVAPFIGVSKRNTAVFGTRYDATVGGFPVGVVGYGELNTAGGYVCGTYGHVIATAGGIATNELCVENMSGAPNATLPPNRAAGSTDNLSIIQTIATLGTTGHFDVSIGTHYAKNGKSMLTGVYMGSDACITYGQFIDATSTVGPDKPLLVRGAGGKSYVAAFQYMNTSDDLVTNTKWLNSVGATLAGVTAGGSFQATGVANTMSRLRIGAGSPIWQGHLTGVGQTTAAVADAGSKDGSLLIQDTGGAAGSGGALLIGGAATDGKFFAGIKGLLTNGTNNSTGDLAFSVRLASTDAALTKAWSIDGSVRHLLPAADNGINIGSASFRLNTVYAGTGTINTSDERVKANIHALSEAEKAVSRELRKSISIYQLKEAITTKGDAAREHVGVIAQRVIAICEAGGIDPWRKGFMCSDEILTSVIKTRKVVVPVKEEVEETISEIVVEDGIAVRRHRTVKTMREKVKTCPIIGVDGKPEMQSVFVRWDGGDEPTYTEMREVERPVFDKAGKPVMRFGKPVTRLVEEEVTLHRAPIVEDQPVLHSFPEMQETDEEYEVMEATGETRLGIRDTELLYFMLASID